MPALIVEAGKSFMTPPLSKMGARETLLPSLDLDPSMGPSSKKSLGPSTGVGFCPVFHIPKYTSDRHSLAVHGWDTGEVWD